MTDRVRQVLLAAKEGLVADLRRAEVNKHSTAKGNATETGWSKFLSDHLPRRYEVTQGFVVASDGSESQQLDVVICDRHYTTILCDDKTTRYVPAESVYAVFEVKQSLSKQHIEAAQKKVASVRRLHRTSTSIPHAGGRYDGKQPGEIVGGLLATRSDWSDPFAEAATLALDSDAAEGRLDLLAAADAGAAEVTWRDGRARVSTCSPEVGLPWFFLTLVHRLQAIGSVTAADYMSYRATLEK